MTDNHPIRPPHELVQQWVSLACENEGYETWQDLATQAARWGADQELDACCEWMLEMDLAASGDIEQLLSERRHKPPTLKEQALALINSNKPYLDDAAMDTIRRAIEALPDS